MPMNVDIETSWKAALKDEFNSAYFGDLKSFLKQERASHTLYPAGQNIFSAFNKTPINEVKYIFVMYN